MTVTLSTMQTGMSAFLQAKGVSKENRERGREKKREYQRGVCVAITSSALAMASHKGTVRVACAILPAEFRRSRLKK